MEIRQLKYFISAATHLNFTKAAKECFIVQTAMTQQIANLEKELGVKLFERHSRGLALTRAGELFLREAREIVTRTETAQARMIAFQAGHGSLLRLGYHGEMFKEDLTALLRQARQKEPLGKVQLFQLTQKEMLEALRDGRVDLAFTPYSPFLDKEDWLAVDLLAESRCMLVVARDHPQAARDRVTAAQLEQVPIVSFGVRNEEEMLAQASQQGIQLRLYDVAWDHTSIEILIESGCCAGLWEERMNDPERYPRLKFLPIEGFTYRKRLVMIWKKGELPPAAERFRTLALERFHGED